MKYIKTKKIFESQEKIYYNSHGETMLVSDFIEIEIEERDNYELDDVYEWMEKYDFDGSDYCIWVTKNKRDVYKYILPTDYYDRIENGEDIQELMYEEFGANDVDIFEYPESSGTIIEETDDGDGGFLFILNK